VVISLDLYVKYIQLNELPSKHYTTWVSYMYLPTWNTKYNFGKWCKKIWYQTIFQFNLHV